MPDKYLYSVVVAFFQIFNYVEKFILTFEIRSVLILLE